MISLNQALSHEEKHMTKELALRDITLFSKLSDQALTEIETLLKAHQLSAGEIIFNQGDPGDELIIVEYHSQDRHG